MNMCTWTRRFSTSSLLVWSLCWACASSSWLKTVVIIQFVDWKQKSHLYMLAFLSRISGQSYPTYFLFLLWDNVHSHQDIKCIIHATSNVLLIYGLKEIECVMSRHSLNSVEIHSVYIPFEQNLVISFHFQWVLWPVRQQPTCTQI